MSYTKTYLLSALLALLVPCVWWEAAAAEVHHYQLRIDQGLQQVEVVAQLAGPGLRVRARLAEPTHQPDWQTCAQTQPKQINPQTVDLGVASCLHYVAPLVLFGSERMPIGARSSVVTAPASWLWLPELQGDDRVEIQVQLADGVSLSVPWPQRGEIYEISASPQSSTGLAVIGQFQQFSVPGLAKPIALVDDYGSTHLDKLSAWLDQTIAAVRRLVRFQSQVQVLVFAVPPRGASPVPFGRVARDQGESVHLFVDTKRNQQDLHVDWTAAHEFAHLFLPYIREEQKWISEGFASYFQNLGQVSSAAYTSEEGWQRLSGSLQRAEQQQLAVSPNAAASGSFWQNRLLIYWSGAALALHADVALRSRANHPVTLSHLLQQLADCCLPSAKIWRGDELFQQLDRLGGDDTLMRLYARYADHMGMPPTALLLEELGVRRLADGSVVLHDDAPLAAVRRQIM